MSQTVSYSHVYRYRNLFGRSLQPIFSVELFNGTRANWRGYALLDSGADYCVFDEQVANWLKIDFTKLSPSTIDGVSGSSSAIQLELGLKFGPLTKPILCKVYFVRGLNKGNRLPNLIGRSGIFNHLQIGFDERAYKVYMEINP